MCAITLASFLLTPFVASHKIHVLVFIHFKVLICFLLLERGGCHEILVSVLTLLFSSVLSVPNSWGLLHYLPDAGFQLAPCVLCPIPCDALPWLVYWDTCLVIQSMISHLSSGMFCVYSMGKGAVVLVRCYECLLYQSVDHLFCWLSHRECCRSRGEGVQLCASPSTQLLLWIHLQRCEWQVLSPWLITEFTIKKGFICLGICFF